MKLLRLSYPKSIYLLPIKLQEKHKTSSLPKSFILSSFKCFRGPLPSLVCIVRSVIVYCAEAQEIDVVETFRTSYNTQDDSGVATPSVSILDLDSIEDLPDS